MFSMTGYGRGSAAADGRELTIELRAVNHRFLDIGMRLPKQLSFIEDPIRSGLTAGLSRGHVDVSVNYCNRRNDALVVDINESLVQAYLATSRKISQACSLVDDLSLSAVLRLPDVAVVREADDDPGAILSLVTIALTTALDALLAMRLEEGRRLVLDLFQRAEALGLLVEQMEECSSLVVETYRMKLDERIEILLAGAEVDRMRLATEVALMADRACIDEELVRARSHLQQMHQLLASDEPAGRRLDFLTQEMNREFNTIGSKAGDTTLTNLVLAAKAEIEKIREQVQNIE